MAVSDGNGMIIPGGLSRSRPTSDARMKVKDYFIQGRPGWVRLHEKAGKEHEVPCHQTLERFLDDYLAVAGIARDAERPCRAHQFGLNAPVLSKPNRWCG